jgi:hypothetical protein
MKPSKLITLFAAMVLTACGIDGGGAPLTPVTVVSHGTITGFGSVIVNGVRYDIGSAMITVDGNSGTESDLAVGQIVVIRGTLDVNAMTGSANSVDFDDAVEGPITAIDATAGTLTVLEQNVIIDAGTTFDDSLDPASLAGLAVDDVVEVTGFRLADGSIKATRIELKMPGGELEVTGFVRNAAATTFEINSLVVDYSAAMLDDFPSGMPENGQLVEAKGDALGGSGELLASRVEFKGNDLAGDAGDRFEIEGFVTRFVSTTDFDVQGLPVTTNAQTVFVNGTSADLALDRKVEVEGTIDAAGVVVAENIEFRQSGTVRIHSLVEDVQASQLTILGIVVNINASTRIDDTSSANLQPFDITDINVGDYVEIRGFEVSGEIIATRLEREDFDGEVALRGFVETINDPNFTILGVAIQTNGATRFQDADKMQITASVFFGQAQGRLVEAEGVLSNGMIIADEVELKD